MKRILLIIITIHLSLLSFCQVTDYENKLALYISEFKNHAFSDDIRLGLLDEVSSIKDQIDIQIGLMNASNSEYQSYLSTQKKIIAFNNVLRCFVKVAGNFCRIEEFKYIMNLLKIIPQELPNLKCDLATFYEVSFNDFKAVLVYNHYPYQEVPGEKIIMVEYDVLLDGKAVSGSNLNVGPGMIRCINYQSDKNKYYHKIVAVKCRENINN